MAPLLITFKRPNGKGSLHKAVTPVCDNLHELLALLEILSIRARDVVGIREASPEDVNRYAALKETI